MGVHRDTATPYKHSDILRIMTSPTLHKIYTPSILCVFNDLSFPHMFNVSKSED